MFLSRASSKHAGNEASQTQTKMKEEGSKFQDEEQLGAFTSMGI